jgi:hypothetical protein
MTQNCLVLLAGLMAFPVHAASPLALDRLGFGMTPKACSPGDESVELARALSVAQIPLDKLSVGQRGNVEDLLKNASLFARGRAVSFPCRPCVYEWLLDHPNWGFRGWRALGARCATVEPQPGGWFVGVDEQGSRLRWQSVLTEPGRRLWYVEGTGRVAPWTPSVTLRALVVLRYQEVVGLDGRTGIRHRAELFAQFEEKGIAWLAKLTGVTAEGAAHRALDQIELFFSGMAWYASEHPAWVHDVFRPNSASPAEERQAVETLCRQLTLPPKS